MLAQTWATARSNVSEPSALAGALRIRDGSERGSCSPSRRWAAAADAASGPLVGRGGRCPWSLRRAAALRSSAESLPSVPHFLCFSSFVPQGHETGVRDTASAADSVVAPLECELVCSRKVTATQPVSRRCWGEGGPGMPAGTCSWLGTNEAIIWPCTQALSPQNTTASRLQDEALRLREGEVRPISRAENRDLVQPAKNAHLMNGRSGEIFPSSETINEFVAKCWGVSRVSLCLWCPKRAKF